MDHTLKIIVLIALILILDLMKLFFRNDRLRKHGLDTGACMTIGGRDVQEDQYDTLTTEAGMMAVLADGAGREFGGRIAAKTAVDTCVEIFKDYNAFNNPQYYFRKAFHCANREIVKVLEDENRGRASAGCIMIRDGFLYYAVAGNVRICVYRDGSLVPLSVGHTVAVLAEQKFQEGKLSRQDALRMLEDQRLYNYLGKDDFKDIEIFDAPVKLKQDDIVVLMSDGIYDCLSTRVIEEVLYNNSACQQMAYELIELVNTNPAEEKDNASVILIGIRSEGIRR
ncbi:MAG: SpoIIE family protein phosphatase [Lachnospiraceae bacterium]|jgi:serine/threonine protein phosphatase PrpC|nr:SpoIIE family protein phosphatase [Lachnospiraceae bacterium]